MLYDFDTIQDRRNSDSSKWNKYGPEVLPLWVADMDFVSAEPIVRALRERVEHGIFGYPFPTEEFYQAVCIRFKRLYEWDVKKEHIYFLPGVVTGQNFAFQTYSSQGEGVLVQSPVYHHFINDPVSHGRLLQSPPLVQNGNTYEIDFDSFEKAITRETKIFILCNPHNPVGRVYTRKELQNIAEVCLRHELIICSDEIHCDLLYPGNRHIPIATLSTEVANRTVTLVAPSKTFNLAGLRFGMAIIQNEDMKKKWEITTTGVNPKISMMGQVAALAGYQNGQEWLDQVLAYLTSNRNFLSQIISEKLPGIHMTRMEATFLAWLDCRESGITENPFQFFLKEAKVAMNDGEEFGKVGKGFVRLNLACSKKILCEAVDRMSFALQKV